jgi:hypothetical protein
MSAERSPSVSTSSGSSASRTVKRRGRPAGAARTAAAPGAAASLEAKRRAAAILEVLAGVRRPREAAAALGVSLPRYYLLEQQALRGLVAACEPRSPGGPRLETRLAQLEQQLRQRERECARQQALVRAAQRSVGLALPPAGPPLSRGQTAAQTAKHAKPQRRRRPTVRALKAAGALRANSSGLDAGGAVQPPAGPDAGAEPPGGRGQDV